MKTIDLPIVLPDWAKWRATDSDGCMSLYENKPVLDTETPSWLPTSGRVRLAAVTVEPADYTITLVAL